MKEHRATITISKEESDYIRYILTHEPKNESECIPEGTAIDHEAQFDDGTFIAVQVCGVGEYEEGGCNTPWTQAVLYSPKGYEMNCSDVEETYFGFWSLDYNDDIYIATVKEQEE